MLRRLVQGVARLETRVLLGLRFLRVRSMAH